MAKIIRDATLTSIANAIRAKADSSGSMVFPQGFISTLDSIPTDASGYKIATGTINYPTKTSISSSKPFTIAFGDFTQLQGAILMVQQVSSASKSECVMSLSSFGGDFATNTYGQISYNVSIGSSRLMLNGNILSWAPATGTRYLHETYFYMVWGN